MTPLGIIIGLLSCFALAAILGILFVYLVQLSRFRFAKLKGVLYGYLVWFLIYGGARSALHLSSIQDYSPSHTLIQFFLHLLFGYILGVIVSKKGGLIFKDES